MLEAAKFSESVRIIKYNPNKLKGSTSMNLENFKWTSKITIEKYNNDISYNNKTPDDILVVSGNTAFLSGINLIWKLVNGQSADVFPLNGDNAYIGVGNSAATALSTQTRLLGSSTAYAPMDNSSSTFPAISNNVITLRSIFGPEVANFTWNEWGVLNGDPSNIAPPRTEDNIIQFNRKVESMGTKVLGSTWVIVADLTISP